MTVKKIKMIAIIVCLLVFVGATVVAGQAYRRYVDHQSQLETQKLALENLKNEIQRLKLSLERFEAEKVEFAGYLFVDRDVPAFLEGISHNALETSVKVLDMKTRRFQEVSVPDTLKGEGARMKQYNKQTNGSEKDSQKDLKRILTLAAMPITIKVEGTYASLVRFFRNLESSKQLLSVSDIHIQSDKYYPSLKCDFTLKIYSLKTLAELENS